MHSGVEKSERGDADDGAPPHFQARVVRASAGELGEGEGVPLRAVKMKL